MAKANFTAADFPKNKTATTSESVDEDTLRKCIHDMDSLAHDGFSQIAAIARLAKEALKGADDGPWIGDISMALTAILEKAHDSGSWINTEAEQVGCAYYDPELLRRHAVRQAKLQEAAA